MNRRAFLSAAAGLGALAFSPETVFAAAANGADWTLGLADVEGDVAPRELARVHGRAPAGLDGVLYRNGPARFRRGGSAVGHWFDGDGLVRRYAIADGQAQLAARFVDTPKRRVDTAVGAIVTPGFGTAAGPGAQVRGPDDVNAANTSVMMAGQALWALWEAGSPAALDPDTLETRGFHTFRPDLKGMPFLAHPRVEPDGRVWNLGVSGSRAVVWRLSPDGALEAATPLTLPRASYLHDFTATARHLVIVLQPWIHERMVAPVSAGYVWRADAGTQVLVLDKDDLSRRRVYELPAFSAFHMGDAWEDADGTIRFDICTTPTPEFAVQGARDLVAGRAPAGADATRLSFVTLRPDGSGAIEHTATPAEFPRSDPRVAGRARARTVVLTRTDPRSPFFQAVAVQDWRRDRTEVFDFGPRTLVEEMVFVPRGAGEFDGWLVGTSVNLDARATELHVFDARHLADGPLCTWRADVALPVSFHGVFAARRS
ncbi:carotenoid oxygenase family protein [Phenylobacterium sp.]|uniref:carotenoid oxygenase family protein n=1 Tax=Phenylobacterium sp. TaxID=1871053 RepID=UPI0035B05F5D